MITGLPDIPGTIGTLVNGRQVINALQACRIVGIERSTLYLWVQLGRIETIRTASGQLRIFADTLFCRDPRGRKPRRRSVTAVSRS